MLKFVKEKEKAVQTLQAFLVPSPYLPSLLYRSDSFLFYLIEKKAEIGNEFLASKKPETGEANRTHEPCVSNTTF